MSKVTVLGGCGAVGSVAVKTLAGQETFSQVVIADYNIEKANSMVAEMGSGNISALQFDALDQESVRAAIAGSDIVLNCVGPFHSTVKPILKVVIESGINYVDVCDDVDVTLEILGDEWDRRAKDAGVSALIGMGSSPGTTNLLGKFIYDNLLDETDSIDIFHTHGGEVVEGEGVIGHRFHCMSIDIPMFLDGELQHVKYFAEDGIALRQTYKFPLIGETPIYPYPHPEQVTMPRYMKLKRVTNKGSVIPNEYYDLTRELCRLGLASKTPLDVRGRQVVPYNFAVAYILKERERILRETNFGPRRGCVSVIARGKKDGKFQEVRIHQASTEAGLGEGTGWPAAVGTLLMQGGKVTRKGIFPPEAGVDPQDFLALVSTVIDFSSSGGDKTIFMEIVDEQGNVTSLDIN